MYVGVHKKGEAQKNKVQVGVEICGIDCCPAVRRMYYQIKI